MSRPAAKMGDQIVGVDVHIVLVPSPGGPVPTPLPHPFSGIIQSNCSTNVLIQGRPAATLGSVANNIPPHIPTPPGVSFANPPLNNSTIMMGSATVLINNKPAARAGDTGLNCGDPPAPTGTVIAVSTVLIGG